MTNVQNVYLTTVDGSVVPFRYDPATSSGVVNVPDGNVAFGAPHLRAARSKVRRIWKMALENRLESW